jgi:hypothetical protein
MNVMSCMQTPFEVKRLSRFRRFVEPKQEETKANAARRPGKAKTAVKRQQGEQEQQQRQHGDQQQQRRDGEQEQQQRQHGDQQQQRRDCVKPISYKWC